GNGATGTLAGQVKLCIWHTDLRSPANRLSTHCQSFRSCSKTVDLGTDPERYSRISNRVFQCLRRNAGRRLWNKRARRNWRNVCTKVPVQSYPQSIAVSSPCSGKGNADSELPEDFAGKLRRQTISFAALTR